MTTNRAVMMDMMAHRYGCLPSHILKHSDSFDVWVFETSQAYQDWHHKMEQAKSGKGPLPSPDIPINKLQEMMDKVKGKKVDSKNNQKPNHAKHR